MRRSGVAVLLAVALVGLFDNSSGAQQTRSTDDRVYSATQASRGQALYTENCASCHGESLQGSAAPPLAGADFLGLWGQRSLLDLANKIFKTMPANAPGKLTLQQSTDVVAYMLQIGKFPAGDGELSANDAALKPITLSAGAPSARPAIAPLPGHGPSFPPGGNLAQVMRGILFSSSNLIFNVQTQDPGRVKPSPTTSNSGSGGFSWNDWGAGIYPPWEMVDYAAVAIAESAPLMLTPGRRCENGKPVPVEDANWIKFSQEMFEAGLAVYKASQTRNQEVVSEATNQLADSCFHCHEVYRDHPAARRGDPPNRALRCTPRAARAPAP